MKIFDHIDYESSRSINLAFKEGSCSSFSKMPAIVTIVILRMTYHLLEIHLIIIINIINQFSFTVLKVVALYAYQYRLSWYSSYYISFLKSEFWWGVDTGIWTNVTTTTNGPSARFSVAGDCLDPFKAGVLVFIGGCNKSLEALDDMYYLYTGSS